MEDYNYSPQQRKKQIHFPLPWKQNQKKTKQAPVTVRRIQQKKPQWDDRNNAQAGLFDPQMQKHAIKNEKYQARKVQKGDEEYDDFNDNQYEKIGKKHEKKAQDPRTKQVAVMEEKMEKERRVYESYHTLAQIQELTNKENARKNAQVLGKHQKELQQLRWMIDQEDTNKEDNEKIQQERYKKLLDQKQLNMSLKNKMVDQKRHQTNLVFKRNAQIEQAQPDVRVREDRNNNNPAAEYIEGMMWENDPRPVQKGVVNIHDQNEDATRDDGANKRVMLFQKKQKEKNEQMEVQLMDLQREQALRNYEVDNLIELHKNQMQREEELQNRHFSAIEQKVNQLKGVVDPLEEKMQRKQDNDKFTNNVLSRATAKMVQVYEEKLTDMLIDDLLYELVDILQEEEEKAKKENKRIKREAVVRDYIEEFKELVDEQDEIEDRIKIKHKSYDFYNGPSAKQRQYLQEPIMIQSIGIELGMGVMVNILEKRNKFSEGLYKLSHYSRRNQECFRILTEELIDEIMYEETQRIDQANSEFAEAIFANEFK